MNSGPNAISYYLRLLWERRPRRTVTVEGGYRVQFEHPTQLLASTFLRALGTGDLELIWSRLSVEARGLLEGRYAAHAGLALHLAAGVDDDIADPRLAEVVAPLLSAARGAAAGGHSPALGPAVDPSGAGAVAAGPTTVGAAAADPADAALFAALGVSAARLVDRATAYVLLLRDFPEERIVREEEWQPAYLLAFVKESGEWHVDLGRTATLSAEAGLPDPLGAIR